MGEINSCLDALVEAVENSPELARYKEAVARVDKYPEKKQRLHEFRTKTYELQNAGDEVDIFSKMDRLEDSFRDVYKDDVMKEYVYAEAAVCKIAQTVAKRVIGCMYFKVL